MKQSCFHCYRQALRGQDWPQDTTATGILISQRQGALAALSLPVTTHDLSTLLLPYGFQLHEFCCLVISVTLESVFLPLFIPSIYPLTQVMSKFYKQQLKKYMNTYFSPTSWDKAIYSLLEFGHQTLVQFIWSEFEESCYSKQAVTRTHLTDEFYPELELALQLKAFVSSEGQNSARCVKGMLRLQCWETHKTNLKAGILTFLLKMTESDYHADQLLQLLANLFILPVGRAKP